MADEAKELFGDMDEDEVKPEVPPEASPTNGGEDYSQEDLFGDDEPEPQTTDAANSSEKANEDEPTQEELFGEEDASGSDNEKGKPKKTKSAAKKLADIDEADDEAVANLKKEHEEDSKKDVVVLQAKGRPLQLLSSMPPRLPGQAQVVLARFPNIVSIDPTPFDPDTYEVMVPVATSNQHDAAAEKQRVQLGVENVIRWRVVTDEHGQKKRQSNARLVEWSDGSIQLLLGNEVMDAFQHKIDGTSNLMYSDFEDRKKNTDRKPNSSLAFSEAKQCFGPVSERIHFQNAAGATSKSHMKLRAILQEKHMHDSKIKVTRAAAEIERRQEERERAEKEFERTLDTQARKRRRNTEKAKAARGGDGKLSRDFLEAGADEEAEDNSSPRERQYRAEEEEEYSGGVSHEKKVGRQAPKRRGGAEDDEESGKRLMKLKGDEGKDDENSSADEDFEEGDGSSEEESESESDEASESEEEDTKGKKGKGKAKKDDNEEEEPQKKKQKAASEAKTDKPDDPDEAAVNVKTGKKRRVIDDE